MATTIHILPSGRDFVSEGNSTLLEAGLRAGLALAYACSNGNCGQCRARIISGQVQKVRHHDYRFSDAEKTNGHVLMCCHTAVTDVRLEALEANSSSEIPLQQITARVKSVEILNSDVALLHLKTPRTNRLRFLAGQYVQLGGENMPSARHSISSCPCDDMNLHFQIPMLPDDAFSNDVFKRLKKGDTVNITGPGGNFILNEDSPRPLVFVAWHTGFAPLRSLIEHAMALDLTSAIHLIWISDTKTGHYLDNLCRSWQDALDNFNYLPVDIDMSSDSTFQVVDMNAIIGQLNIEPDDLAEFDFYIAGNKVLLETCKKTLLGSGLPEEQLHIDSLAHN